MGNRKKHFLHEFEGRCCPFDIAENCCNCHKGLQNIFELWKTRSDIRSGEAGNPSFRLIESTNRLQHRSRSHIEPVPGVRGNVDEVTFFTKYNVHVRIRVYVKQSRAIDEETCFIFRMSVLIQK